MERLKKYIWLSQCFPVGSEKPKKLLDKWDIDTIYANNEEEYQRQDTVFLTQNEKRKLANKFLDASGAVVQACKEKEIHMVCCEDEQYPARLRNIYNPPAVLYYKGNISTIDEDIVVSVIGTRNPSEYGKRTTGNLCFELAKAGVVIASGCAAGVDSFAHAGALKAGKPTVGVLGCGVDVNYPSKNEALKKEILKKGGALLSELPPGTYPYPAVFPIRNRIMSAISLGVLVTEAPQKSGALITAAHGLEQGKDIFCIPPHDIYDKRYDGVKSLLKDGAVPVMSPVDVIEQYLFDFAHKIESATVAGEKSIVVSQDDKGNVLPEFAEESTYRRKRNVKKEAAKPTEEEPEVVASEQPPVKPEPSERFTDDQKKLYGALEFTPKFIDDIVNHCKMDLHKVLPILTEFEIDGIITAYSGRRYGLRREI